jgi:hypothetical protein
LADLVLPSLTDCTSRPSSGSKNRTSAAFLYGRHASGKELAQFIRCEDFDFTAGIPDFFHTAQFVVVFGQVNCLPANDADGSRRSSRKELTFDAPEVAQAHDFVRDARTSPGSAACSPRVSHRMPAVRARRASSTPSNLPGKSLERHVFRDGGGGQLAVSADNAMDSLSAKFLAKGQG